MSLCAFPVVTITAALMVTGCGHPSVGRTPVQADLSVDDRSILAGEWKYEDGAAVILRLDEHGNGTYAWEEGRFETIQFGDHT